MFKTSLIFIVNGLHGTWKFYDGKKVFECGNQTKYLQSFLILFTFSKSAVKWPEHPFLGAQ